MLYGNGKYEIAEEKLAEFAGCAYNRERDEIAPLGFDMYGRPVYHCDYVVSAGASVLRAGIVTGDDEIDGEHSVSISQHDGTQGWIPFSEIAVLLDSSPFHSRRCVRDRNGDPLFLGTFVRDEDGYAYKVVDFSADKVHLKPLKSAVWPECEETVPAKSVVLEDYEAPLGRGVLHWVYEGDIVNTNRTWSEHGEVLGMSAIDEGDEARVDVIYGEYIDDYRSLLLKEVSPILEESPRHYGRYFKDKNGDRVRVGDKVRIYSRFGSERDEVLFEVVRFTTRCVDLKPVEPNCGFSPTESLNKLVILAETC